MARIDLKVVLLGQQSVGKTCLLDRYVNDAFEATSKNTIGAGFAAKKVDLGANGVVSLGIWDTAGAERFESLSRMYYHGAMAAIVCFDPTNRTSFEKAQYWVSEVRSQQPSCRIYLVLTKCDTLPPGDLAAYLQAIDQGSVAEGHTNGQPVSSPTTAPPSASAPLTSQSIPPDDIVHYATSVGAQVVATSSKTGLGIQQLFHNIAESLAAAGTLERQPSLPNATLFNGLMPKSPVHHQAGRPSPIIDLANDADSVSESMGRTSCCS